MALERPRPDRDLPAAEVAGAPEGDAPPDAPRPVRVRLRLPGEPPPPAQPPAEK